jgi:hypothetical protein
LDAASFKFVIHATECSTYASIQAWILTAQGEAFAYPTQPKSIKTENHQHDLLKYLDALHEKKWKTLPHKLSTSAWIMFDAIGNELYNSLNLTSCGCVFISHANCQHQKVFRVIRQRSKIFFNMMAVFKMKQTWKGAEKANALETWEETKEEAVYSLCIEGEFSDGMQVKTPFGQGEVCSFDVEELVYKVILQGSNLRCLCQKHCPHAYLRPNQLQRTDSSAQSTSVSVPQHCPYCTSSVCAVSSSQSSVSDCDEAAIHRIHRVGLSFAFNRPQNGEEEVIPATKGARISLVGGVGGSACVTACGGVQGHEFIEGDNVEVNYKGMGRYYAGKILHIHCDGNTNRAHTYNIQYGNAKEIILANRRKGFKKTARAIVTEEEAVQQLKVEALEALEAVQQAKAASVELDLKVEALEALEAVQQAKAASAELELKVEALEAVQQAKADKEEAVHQAKVASAKLELKVEALKAVQQAKAKGEKDSTKRLQKLQQAYNKILELEKQRDAYLYESKQLIHYRSFFFWEQNALSAASAGRTKDYLKGGDLEKFTDKEETTEELVARAGSSVVPLAKAVANLFSWKAVATVNALDLLRKYGTHALFFGLFQEDIWTVVETLMQIWHSIKKRKCGERVREMDILLGIPYKTC